MTVKEKVMEFTLTERLGIKNGLNRIVCPVVRSMESELVEIRLCLENREVPNVEMCLRRVKRVEELVRKLDCERVKWNQEIG
jgi:hypothetical protein